MSQRWNGISGASDMSLEEIQAAIARLATKPEHREISAFLKDNPWFFGRFVMDSRNAGLDLDDLLWPSRRSVVLRPIMDNDYQRSDDNFNPPEAKRAVMRLTGQLAFRNDLVRIVAEPDPTENEQVRITIQVEHPQSLARRDRLAIHQQDADHQDTVRQLTLDEADDGRVQGSTSIPCSWKSFTGAGASVSLEIELPEKDKL